MAFFDIMGSSQRIASGQLETVYNFYSYMTELCAKQTVPLSFPGVLPEEKGKEIVCLFPVKHAFFSDTFILWVENDSFMKPRFGGFYEWCTHIFIEAIKRGIPLRGAISRGQAIMDDDKKIYLGEPIVEAAKLEHMQSWLGVTLGLSCRMIQPTEVFCLLPYNQHLKTEIIKSPNNIEVMAEGKVRNMAVGWGGIASNFVLDWPRIWRNQENADSVEAISKLNTDSKFSIYYDNTVEFIK
jgi:hypothetical protein